MTSEREFDLILLGPTGYTGNFTSEYIAKSLPTNLKWAIAGRSGMKMESIAQNLKAINADRIQPAVLVVQMNDTELTELAQKTRLIINCVGPYHLYSTPVVEACAKNGTHYLDVTGESPWVKIMIEKYHETAKSSGAIIIHSTGVESAPADMLAWALVKKIREEFSTPTRLVEGCLKEIKSSGPSGGTLATVLGIFDWLSLSELSKSSNPFALAASTPPTDIPQTTTAQRIFGVRSVRDLGTLTTSVNGMVDMSIVHRSSTLMPEFYGRRFYFSQMMYVRNALVGFFVHAAISIGFLLLIFAPVRAVLRKFIYSPGSGPRLEDSQDDHVEYHAVATADQDVPSPNRVFGKLSHHGSLYVLTSVLIAEAAMVILTEEEKVKKVSRCGIVTPATLGQEYIDRLDKAGVSIETKVLKN